MAQHTPGVHFQQQQQQQQIVSAQNQVQSQQLSAHQNTLNNNNNYPSPHSQASAPIYNSMTPSNVYIPQQPTGAFYLSTPISSNVFVNNVTANVNVHGYVPHPMPPFIQNPPTFISGEIPQSLSHVAEHTSSSATSSISTTITKEVNISSNPRKSRGGRGRGGNRRNDYIHRQQQQQQQQQNQQILSPSPQDIVNSSLDNGNQAMGPGGAPAPTAAGYSHYYHPFGYFHFCQAPTAQNMIAPPGQQGTSPQLILNTLPMYQGPQMYPCPQFIYQPMVTDYTLVDDKGEEQTTPEGISPHIAWHAPMPMEFPANEYITHTMAAGDVNHNSSSLASSDTPSLLSPNYQIFDQQVHTSIEIQQQMSKLHIYDQPGGIHSQHVSSEHHQQQHMPNIIYGENQQPICPQNISESCNEPVYGIVDLSVPPQTAIEMPSNSTSPLQKPIPENIVKVNKDNSVNNKSKDNVSNSSTNDENYSGDNDNYEIDNNVNNNNNYNNNTEIVTEVPFNTHLVENLQDKNDYLTKSSKQMQSVIATVVSRNPNQSDVNSNYESNKFVPSSGKNDSNENVPNSQFAIVSEKCIDANRDANDSINEIKATSSSANQSSKSGSSVNLITNPQQKKSVASVAVTATPSSTNKQNLNKVLNVPSSSSYSISISSSNSMKNYAATKMASSSPAQTNSQDSLTEKNKLSSSTSQSQQSMDSNKSTKSIGSTVVPQQLQENSRTQDDSRRGEMQVDKINNDNTQNSKRDNLTTSSIVGNSNAIASNPPTQQTPPSWASLFSSRISNTTAPMTAPVSSTNSSSSLNVSTVTKKPIAKVPPFEGTSNLSSSTTTSTKMSYSAASAQGVNNAFNKTKTKDSDMLGGSINDHSKVGMDEWFLKLADFLTNYKVDYSPITLRPRGLTNRSNYCYINATLQALIGCPPLYNLMKSIPKHSPAIYNEKSNIPTIIAMMQLVSEFSYVPPTTLKPLHRRSGDKGQKKDDFMGELSCDQAFEPTNIYKLWNASRSDVEGRQEDAEEFLGYVLNKLNDEMLEVIKLIAPKSNEQNGNVNDGDDTEEWQMIYNNRNKCSVTRQTDFGRTPLSDIFRGELRSRIQREGEHSTDVIQPFFTLQLNIEKAASVKEALEILVGKDQLEGVTGSKTNQEVVAWQQMTLEKLPVVLILHLKWFDYKLEGCTKILKTVEFPIELKIDTKILASKKYSQKQRLYRLFAIVYHDGKEASKGHYVTDVYHTGYSNWIRYDDSSVKPVSENNVLRPRAPRVPYLLYYRRCDTVSQNQNQNKQNTQNIQRNTQQQQQHHHH